MQPHRTLPAVPRRLPWYKKLAFAAVLTIGLPLTSELAARLIHGWHRHWLDCHRPHPTLGWVLRENWAGKWTWTGGYARINAQGLRMDEDIGPKQPGERRLLFLGDSITFGANVATHQTLPSQVQWCLRARGSTWRVLNGGVTSYDPAQEQEWLEAFGWPLAPDALVVVFCRNDLTPSRRHISGVHRSVAGQAGDWLAAHSLLYFKLERLALRLQARWSSQGAVRQLVVDEDARVTGLPFVEQAYQRLAASARARAVPVTLAICPTLDVLTGQQPDDLSARLAALGRDLGWSVIDLAPALSGPPAELTCLFLPNDPIHPSAAGYARLAAALAAHLPD